MKIITRFLIPLSMMTFGLISCKNDSKPAVEVKDDFRYFVEQFEDLRILKYRLPAFESLSLAQKEYIYYLSQAALTGRDIIWDQNFRYNLVIRKTLEAIIDSYSGDRNTDEYKAFLVKKGLFFQWHTPSLFKRQIQTRF